MNIVKTIKTFREKLPYMAVSLALLVSAIAPGVISTHAFAAQVTERSIALSSSSAAATGVTYQVGFTPDTTAGAYSITFCNTTPDYTAACGTAPAGLDVSSATSGSLTVSGTANKLIVTDALTAATTYSVDIDNISNPTASGPLYARIATYADASAASADTTGVGGLDHGSVAISITDTIGVSGAVLETMTFCVAKVDITPNCANASANLPTLKLGETTGSVVALTPTALSTGTLYTQISTNALSGAVITLKSATDCGGLKRAGATVCDIAPAGSSTFTAGTAKFGVKTGTAAAATGATSPIGTLQAVTGSDYNASGYAFTYAANNLTGVTSAIGDPFLDTAGAPVNNQNMPLTFGASISNSTPAGNYATSLSMIATGKF